jgi:hypothetical protein
MRNASKFGQLHFVVFYPAKQTLPVMNTDGNEI